MAASPFLMRSGSWLSRCAHSIELHFLLYWFMSNSSLSIRPLKCRRVLPASAFNKAKFLKCCHMAVLHCWDPSRSHMDIIARHQKRWPRKHLTVVPFGTSNTGVGGSIQSVVLHTMFLTWCHCVWQMSTVGFGDITPNSDWGRLVVLCVIIGALVILPPQINRILRLASRRWEYLLSLLNLNFGFLGIVVHKASSSQNERSFDHKQSNLLLLLSISYYLRDPSLFWCRLSSIH